MSEQRARRILVRAATAGLALSGLALPVHLWVGRSIRGRLFSRPEEVPASRAALVLGARVMSDGSPSPVLEDRLWAGLRLLELGRVERILVSGAADAPEGDETVCMRNWLLANGATERVLSIDPLGVRTWTSLRRAREVFGLDSLVICTQAFHQGRSLFLARRLGLDAVGLTADRRVYRHRHRDALREVFARQLAFLDALWPTN